MHTWQLADRSLLIDRRPLLMGVVNVTPDSFSDGGQFLNCDAAVEHGLRLVADGADVLDVGGESTRPGADPVPLDEELHRVIPVVERLAKLLPVPISIDTSKAEVARQALAAGGHVINDVTALTGDPGMVEVARQTGAGLVIMHAQGTPKTMQIDPRYDDVVREVLTFLQERLARLGDAGIGANRVAIDPGIGFGKRLEHNLDLLAQLPRFQTLGRPLCLGVSRKGFINRVLGQTGWVEQGVGGTVGVVLHAMSRGAVQIARVHDVATVHAAVALFQELEARASPKR